MRRYISEMDYERLHRGLRLLGWRADTRLTNDDEWALQAIIDDALLLEANGRLATDEKDRLALKAFHILEFQIMNVQERALMSSAVYSRSAHLAESVTLIDEALLCYYRGYYAAALALLFIITERYLLSATGWEEGNRKPLFPQLVQSMSLLADQEAATEAESILRAVYARYQSAADASFGFNRHAVHHGLRDFTSTDKMNCVRAFLLLDLFAAAEGSGRGFSGQDEYDEIAMRVDAFGAAISYGREMMLIRPGDERLP